MKDSVQQILERKAIDTRTCTVNVVSFTFLMCTMNVVRFLPILFLDETTAFYKCMNVNIHLKFHDTK